MILLWYYYDILTIILSSSSPSSSSSSSKWLTLKPTFVIWCGRGGRWLLDKLPSLELITRLQSDQDYHLVLMIIICQFCLLVQSHQILCCWHFSKSYIKSISFAAGFSNRLVKRKNRKETDADIYLFFGREILGLSQKFRKSWGYHSFKILLGVLAQKHFLPFSSIWSKSWNMWQTRNILLGRDWKQH